MSWDDDWSKNRDNWQTGRSEWSPGDGGWDRPPRRRRGPIAFILVLVAVVALGGLLLAARARRAANDQPEATAVSDVPPATLEGNAPTLASPLASPTPPTQAPLAAPTTPALNNDIVVFPFEDAIYSLAIDLINESRREAGLLPVVWDAVAAEAGRRHVIEMIEWGYFSHWNLAGLGPEHRYSQAGGANAVRENLHARASVRPPDDWAAVIREAHAGLMNSPGHRENILDPAHTHVGIAIAYSATAGQMRLAQEFTNQYVTLNRWLPLSAERGSRLPLDGTIAADVQNILLDLAWEPLPQPLAVAALNQTQTYTSAAQSLETTPLERAFSREVVLDNAGQPGIYHIRIFADVAGQQSLVMDHAIWVK